MEGVRAGDTLDEIVSLWMAVCRRARHRSDGADGGDDAQDAVEQVMLNGRLHDGDTLDEVHPRRRAAPTAVVVG